MTVIKKSKVKKSISSITLQEITTRENLVSFYNELNEAMTKSFIHLKKKPSKARIKKVCKPILDRWEKTFEGTLKKYLCEIKVNKDIWQKEI